MGVKHSKQTSEVQVCAYRYTFSKSSFFFGCFEILLFLDGLSKEKRAAGLLAYFDFT